jgi:NAD(P)-dependent dehydrogenase (short-subunit alcohol dehydrogenase family)
LKDIIFGKSINFMSFKNQTIVITGGASGIGLAIARLVNKNHGIPLLLDINLQKLNEAKKDLNLENSIIKVDVLNEEELKNCLDIASKKLPPITGLVCSAGKAPMPKRIEDTELSEWNSIIESHLTGTFLSCKIFGSHMAKIGSGSIVNISSVVGFNPGPVLAYGAAKGAIINLTKSLSVQWASSNIRVNAVAPGWTDTPLLQPEERKEKRDLTPILKAVPQKRLMHPNEIAELIYFLLSQNSSSITGSIINCDGGTLAGAGWLPYGGFPDN